MSDPSAPSDPSGPAPDGSSAPPDEELPDEEILEVIDIEDELAAMADAGADFTGADAALIEVVRQRDEYLDALRHLQADFENYKKRSVKQQADAANRAGESLIEKLLPALDTADLAVVHGAGDELKQVWAALLDALEREGLERIAPEGGPFDPTRHDAVMHEPGDGGDQEVAEVLRAGYAWKGRVLRPAMVKVRG